MKLLGAVLAGGRSSRFGYDKAAALVDGVPLLQHVVEALAPQTDAVIVVGRRCQAYATIEDYPVTHQGPLGGLCAALRYAEGRFDAVLTAGCDVLPVPSDLAQRLSPGPAVVAGQPLFGLWPTSLYEALLDHLTSGCDRSMKGWSAAVEARPVELGRLLHNLNTPQDLALYCRSEGSVA
jgi:molybdenum cofactor guanylyltransferase